MEDENISDPLVKEIKNNNQKLRKEIQEYKKLEEELMAKRVYEKAKKRLISSITFGGIVLAIAGVIGIKSIVNYMKDMVTVKLESISEEQINKLVQEEGKRQVTTFVKVQQSKWEEILVATARQQINQITIASSPIRGGGKATISLVKTQSTFDLTSFMTPVRNQGNEGSTVGFATAAALEYQIKKKLNKHVTISPRHIYYHAKLATGFDPHSDTGAWIRDAVKVIQTKGAVSEEIWPYKSGDLKSDPPEGIEVAKHYKISKSNPVSNMDEIKSSLKKNGPAVAGITLYRTSISDEGVAKTGIIPDPSPRDQILGIQAICIVGYDDDKKIIKFKNSWGPEWGDNGYGYISYNYVEKFLTDGWTFTF